MGRGHSGLDRVRTRPVLLALWISAAGCGDETPRPPTFCIRLTYEMCVTAAGRPGFAQCTESGAFGPCVASPSDAGPRD